MIGPFRKSAPRSAGQADDEALLAAYAAGDAAAARLLTERHLPRVLALSVRMLGSRAEAEDVAQEAMLRLWRIAPDWEAGRAQIGTWLYRVASNLCTDRLRRRRGVALDEVAEPVDESQMSADDVLHHEARATALQEALMRLPERQRQAVVLRHIEGLGNPEIAGIMEISTEAVESLTARGKRALQAELTPRRDELGLDI